MTMLNEWQSKTCKIPWWIKTSYNLGNVRLGTNEVAKSDHCTWAIEHAVIHVDIQHLGSHFHLLFGHTQCLLREECERSMRTRWLREGWPSPPSPSQQCLPIILDSLAGLPNSGPVLHPSTPQVNLRNISPTSFHYSESTEALFLSHKGSTSQPGVQALCDLAPSSYLTVIPIPLSLWSPAPSHVCLHLSVTHHAVPSAGNTIPFLSILCKTQLKSHLQEKSLEKPSKMYITLQCLPKHAKHSLQPVDRTYMKYELDECQQVFQIL